MAGESHLIPVRVFSSSICSPQCLLSFDASLALSLLLITPILTISPLLASSASSIPFSFSFLQCLQMKASLFRTHNRSPPASPEDSCCEGLSAGLLLCFISIYIYISLASIVPCLLPCLFPFFHSVLYLTLTQCSCLLLFFSRWFLPSPTG